MRFEVSNRRDLYELLDKRLNYNYETLKEKQIYEDNKNLLKTYILESNLNLPYDLLNLESEYSIEIKPTKDVTLFNLLFIGKKDPTRRALFYLDISNERFWLLHTISAATITDRITDKLVFGINSGLDFPWFYTKFLEEYTKDVTFKGFTLSFNNEFVEEEDTSIEKLSMRLWGESAKRILDVLKSENEFKSKIALSTIGIKSDTEEDERITLEDINFNGKFVARGNSVDTHMMTVNDFVNKYNEKLLIIEKSKILYEKSDFGFKISGEPVSIILEEEIENLDSFIDRLLSSTKPLRIWGLKRKIEKNYYKLNSVDLHTGQKLNMEITPNWLRIYLQRLNCGNTVLRLLTNIQHNYDSNAILEIGDYKI